MSDTISCVHCAQEFDKSEPGCPACGHLLQPVACTRHANKSANGVCVICGDAVCAECNDTSPHYTCPEHRDIPIIEGWAQVYTTNQELDASMICENLRSEGVDAEVLSQRDQTFQVDLGEFAPVRVLVPAFDYLTARDILDTRMGPSGEVAFACETCGEAYEAGQDLCATCGTALRRA